MRFIAIVGLFLYGVANLLAGLLGPFTEQPLPLGVNIALLITGAALAFGAILILRRSTHALRSVVLGLAFASALAVFNERVLGFGHPSHHLVRGAFTLLILWASFRATRSSGIPTRRSDKE